MCCKIVIYACVSFILFESAQGSTAAQEADLYNALLTGYNTNVRPRNNNDEPTDLHLFMYLRYVTRLDELSGILTTAVIMTVYWVDSGLRWDPNSYGNITQIRLDKNSIWSPGFAVLNPATYVESLGTTAHQTFVSYLGQVFWEFGHVIHTTCDIDVTFFPFDTQRCVIEFIPFGMKNNDINLIAHPIDTFLYLENNAWILQSTSVESTILRTQPYAKYFVTLERRYTFYMLNLYSPVLTLAFLNAMVFLIPADSGERIGYAITCLLSLSVYMTFASQSLPNSSKPLPIITFVLMTYIVISTLISVGTIMGLRLHLHDKSSTPPAILTKLFCISRGTCCRKPKVGDVTDSEKKEHAWADVDERKVTWKELAHKFDKFCFVVSSACIFLLTFIYFLVIRTNTFTESI